jgi:hypothetical protein
MHKPLLMASTALVVLAGCGGTGSSDHAPSDVDLGLYVICSGKPRYCAVADTRDQEHEWVGAEALDPEAASRFRRLVGPAPVPQRPG